MKNLKLSIDNFENILFPILHLFSDDGKIVYDGLIEFKLKFSDLDEYPPEVQQGFDLLEEYVLKNTIKQPGEKITNKPFEEETKSLLKILNDNEKSKPKKKEVIKINKTELQIEEEKQYLIILLRQRLGKDLTGISITNIILRELNVIAEDWQEKYIIDFHYSTQTIRETFLRLQAFDMAWRDIYEQLNIKR